MLLLAELRVVQHSSGLTIAIAGIFKEVLTIGAGVAILGDEMSTRKALGLLLCLVGALVLSLHCSSASAR